MKTLFLSLLLFFADAAQAQSVLGQEWLILYRLDRPQAKYVLCRNYQSPENKSISEVVIADTFAIQLRIGLCCVIMSNACVLETKIPLTNKTNTVVQNKMLVPAYGVAFPRHTKVMFNSSITDLEKVNLNGPTEGNLIYEGEAAVRKLKEMGLELPDDADVKRK